VNVIGLCGDDVMMVKRPPYTLEKSVGGACLPLFLATQDPGEALSIDGVIKISLSKIPWRFGCHGRGRCI
jgi:hypothetical protein